MNAIQTTLTKWILKVWNHPALRRRPERPEVARLQDDEARWADEGGSGGDPRRVTQH